MDIRLHSDLERQILRDPGLDAAVHAAADAVVEDARDRAPKQTGAGAESIHAEQVDETPPTYRVSWDPDHFYMGFHELGTEHEPARPFLRPAADAPAHRDQ